MGTKFEEESLGQKLPGSSQMDRKPRYTLPAAQKYLRCPYCPTFNQGERETRGGRFKEMPRGKVYSHQPALGTFDS